MRCEIFVLGVGVAGKELTRGPISRRETGIVAVHFFLYETDIQNVWKRVRATIKTAAALLLPNTTRTACLVAWIHPTWLAARPLYGGIVGRRVYNGVACRRVYNGFGRCVYNGVGRRVWGGTGVGRRVWKTGVAARLSKPISRACLAPV